MGIPSMEEYKAAFFQIIENGAKMRDFCNYVSSVVNNPVALLHPSNIILEKSDDYDQELISEYINSEKNFDYNDAMSVSKLREDVYRSRRARLVYIPYLHNKRVLCGCVYKGNRLALMDIAIRNDPPDEEQMAFIEYAASVFNIIFRLNNFIVRESKDMAMQNMITGILDGTLNLEYQRQGIYTFRVFAVESWRLMWITPFDMARSGDLMFLESVREKLERICDENKNWWCTPYSNLDSKGYVILFDDASKDGIQSIGQLCVEESLYCFISRQIDTFSEMPRAYDDICYMNLMFHNNTSIKAAPGLRYYEDYKVGIALNEVFFSVDKSLLESPLLEEIYTYDKLHDTEYFITLECYFQNDGDLTVMADKMNIHKNTVAYRLKRMSELFGINFRSFRETSDIYYSIQFARKQHLGKILERSRDYDNHD